MADETSSSEELVQRFQAATGAWQAGFQDWATHNPESFARFTAFASHIHERGALSNREQAVIRVALNATATHLYEDGLRASIDSALEAGVTVDEIQEVFELTCGVGMHTMIEGLPVLVDELGLPETDDEMREAQTHVREEFERRRGYWSDFWETVLEMDYEYLEKYTDLSSYPWEYGALDPKLRELVYIAIDASTTHLYSPGLSAHLENAVEYGATRDEILEVFEITSLQGYDTMAVGMPILLELASQRKEPE